MKKAIVSGTEYITYPDSKRPHAMEKVSEPLCSRERHPTTQDTGDKTQIRNCPGHRCPGHRIKNHQSANERMLGNCWAAASIRWTSFLNSKSLIYTFPPEFETPFLHFFLLIKKTGFKCNVRQPFRTHNPPYSQIAGHLNKSHTKIQSLSLLLGSGSDRQHKCPLFQFHKELETYPLWSVYLFGLWAL